MKIRKATATDVPTIVQMLADDKLGNKRENFRIPLPNCYSEAFEQIDIDKNQYLLVAESDSNQIIGTLQLTFIQYLTYQGGVRAQIEAVRVHKESRGKGIGKAMIEWAIEKAKNEGAHVIQLTTDKKRPEAIRFYQDLGFTDSHEGMKLHLQSL